MRQFLGMLTLSVLMVIAGSRPATAVNGKPIRIVAIFSMTGIAAPHNEALIPMVKLAVDDINDSGGLLDRAVELIILDNRSTALGSSMAAETAIRLNAVAVVGPHWSSHSLAAAPVLQKAGIPMISPGSTNPDVTRVGDYIFRACFLDSFQGSAMARFAYQDLGARTAVVLRNIDETYSIMLAEFFKNGYLKAGGRILYDKGYRGKAVDFRDILLQTRDYSPDVIFVPGYTRDSGLLIKQAKAIGIEAIFLGGDAWDEIVKYTGDSINGAYQTAPWHPDAPFPNSRYLQQRYAAQYGNPIRNISAPLAYDAVMVLADAIRRAGSTDRRMIRDALAETRGFQGATGTITFDANGDPINKEVVILTYRDHRAVFLKTVKP